MRGYKEAGDLAQRGKAKRRGTEGSPLRVLLDMVPTWVRRSAGTLLAIHILAHEVPVFAVFFYEFIYLPFIK